MVGRGTTYKIFCGNLSESTTSEDLKNHFEEYGKVMESAVVKNFGFVHMETEEERKEAIDSLNGSMLQGQAIVVQSSTGAKKGNRQFGKIFVGNIAPDTKISELRELFDGHGRVTEADLLTNFAFVHMETEEQAKEAIRNLDGYDLNGSRLRVQESTSRVRQQPGMGNPNLCYRCGSAGHWSKECPTDGRNRGPPRYGEMEMYGRGPPGPPRMSDRMERGPSAYGRRYDPYLPPPPPSFARDRMRSYRDEYDPMDRYDRYYADRPSPYDRYERLPPPSSSPYLSDPYDRRPPPPRGDYMSYGRRSPPPRYPPPPPSISSGGSAYPAPRSRMEARPY